MYLDTNRKKTAKKAMKIRRDPGKLGYRATVAAYYSVE